MKNSLLILGASALLSLSAPQVKAFWWHASRLEAVEACREWKLKKGVFTVDRKPEIPWWKKDNLSEKDKFWAEIMKEAEAMYPDGIPSFDGLEKVYRKEGVTSQFDVARCITENETKQVLGYAYLVKGGSHWPNDLESLPNGGQMKVVKRFRW